MHKQKFNFFVTFAVETSRVLDEAAENFMGELS